MDNKLKSVSSNSSEKLDEYGTENFTSIKKAEIHLSTSSEENEPLDKSHLRKQLTITTDNMICRLSALHLSKLQETFAIVEKDPQYKKCFEKVEKTEQNLRFQKKLENENLCESKVLVLYTGGTIGMRCIDGVYAPEQHYLPQAIRKLPLLNDFEYTETLYQDAQMKPYCLPIVRGLKKRIIYYVVEYEPLLDSSDMTFDDWIRVACDIEKSYSAYDGFVILHGTDTLAYTACALSFMMENLGKPVVLTGAQIPVAEVRSDGRENMIGALIVAGSYDIPEVMTLFNNKLMRGNRVTKIDNTELDAFNSPNMAPLAILSTTINVNYESIFRSPEVAPFKVNGKLCRNVVVLRVFPSMPIEAVQASLRPPTRGVILQTFGAGNIPIRRTDIMDEIKLAINRGCLMLNVSQCLKGRAEPYYKNGKILADNGVIFGSDITTEAALTKMAYILANDDWDLETKTLMLNRNLRGEITVFHSERLDELDLVLKLGNFLSITSSLETRLLRNALLPPLICNAAQANDVELLEQLRVCGANLAQVDYSMRTALHVAATAGSSEAVNYLLKHGVSVHGRDSYDDNALICAVRSKKLNVIQAIRSAGGQLVIPLPRIGIELCLAANQIDLYALEAWNEAGADLSTPDYNGRTALHVASNRALPTVVKYLCSKEVDPNVCDNFGNTPLDECMRVMHAIETIHPSVFASEKYQASTQRFELSAIDDISKEETTRKKSVLCQHDFFNSNALELKIERSEEAKCIYIRLKKVRNLLNELINKNRSAFEEKKSFNTQIKF